MGVGATVLLYRRSVFQPLHAGGVEDKAARRLQLDASPGGPALPPQPAGFFQLGDALTLDEEEAAWAPAPTFRFLGSTSLALISVNQMLRRLRDIPQSNRVWGAELRDIPDVILCGRLLDTVSCVVSTGSRLFLR